MGGVDLHDNAVQNYSVSIRAKKWYWPLWISTLNSSLVNAWKLDCFRRRYQNKSMKSQKEFRVELAYSLMVKQQIIDSTSDDSAGDSQTHSIKSLPIRKSKHLIVKIEQNKKWRSKKWYWPLWISTLNSSLVNAWKLDCFRRRNQNKSIKSQKEFRVELAYSLMVKQQDIDSTSDDSAGDSQTHSIKSLLIISRAPGAPNFI
ncbi:hypothetical protein CVS40_4886 [Lucilia cuprina]|nr:hypothetical protein CVS40_4886 [Lucilia cuprina]